MRAKTIQVIFFGLGASILLVLLYFILKPFLGVVFLSAVLAVSFYPLYEWILKKCNGRKSLSGLLTTLVVVVCIVIPVALLSASLLREAIMLYDSVVLGQDSIGLIERGNELFGRLVSVFPQGIVGDKINLEVYIRQALNWLISHFDSVFAAIFEGLFKFILMLLALYYFFTSGERIKRGIVEWSPLSDTHDEDFLKTLRSSVDAVLQGRILVSVAQGLFIGIGFAIFGVGSPVLWGFVGGVASLIPILGTSIIIIPAVAYLFLSGHMGAGVGLLIWGVVAVGLIDNVLSFLFFRNKIKVHPLLILFAILGGVEVFGAIGFLVGPIVVSAFLALMKIYPFIMSPKTEQS